MLRFATVQGRAHPRGAARWAVGVLGFRPTAIIQYGTNLVEGGRWHFEPSPPGRPLGRWAVGVQLAQTYATRPKCNSRMAMCVQSGDGLSVAALSIRLQIQRSLCNLVDQQHVVRPVGPLAFWVSDLSNSSSKAVRHEARSSRERGQVLKPSRALRSVANHEEYSPGWTDVATFFAWFVLLLLVLLGIILLFVSVRYGRYLHGAGSEQP